MRTLTRARIGLARTGNAVGTADVLAFQHDHARARRAIETTLDAEALGLAPPPIVVTSRAADRATFIRRPDLGRRLRPDDLSVLPRGDWDVAFVIGDGLSALAAQQHAPALIAACRSRLPGWRLAPVVAARNARVALGDEIGAALGARFVVMLIGERPGLSVADSLGAYLTLDPRVGRTDAERNCLSNIHPHGGLTTGAAARKLVWLLERGRQIGATGVALKDEAPGDDAVETSAAPVLPPG
ncbi:ethanolamine ammonia-lyase subunit EutC [Ameyamaea chiangmaiensis]|uniref:ethanolamine ammonia-lyase subunit EutC n=1 Tax=Ameyamaea chiangmaiensis TaxID=442969 RepID=UPI002231B399|nr:ethanolamine ammonia-lyase subunit EutC [Ameyamaea chiangmaiensis]